MDNCAMTIRNVHGLTFRELRDLVGDVVFDMIRKDIDPEKLEPYDSDSIKAGISCGYTVGIADMTEALYRAISEKEAEWK